MAAGLHGSFTSQPISFQLLNSSISDFVAACPDIFVIDVHFICCTEWGSLLLCASTTIARTAPTAVIFSALLHTSALPPMEIRCQGISNGLPKKKPAASEWCYPTILTLARVQLLQPEFKRAKPKLFAATVAIREHACRTRLMVDVETRFRTHHLSVPSLGRPAVVVVIGF